MTSVIVLCDQSVLTRYPPGPWGSSLDACRLRGPHARSQTATGHLGPEWFHSILRAGQARSEHGEGAQMLFQLISDLYERVSIIVTSNLRFGDWNAIFGDEKMTDALIGRLTHKGHIVEFVGESYRFRHRLQQEQQPPGESKPEVG